MITHKMRLDGEHFAKIAKREKIIESRLYDDKRQRIKIGDLIEFSNRDNPAQKVYAKVKALHRYQSFDDLFSSVPAERFRNNSKEALLNEIREFYSEKDENRYGVVGIEIELT